jgi:L-fuconolactonase
MIGSDWPVCLLAASYERVMDTARALIAHLPDEDQHAIALTNPVAAYRLKHDATL